jgi:capsular exopolysaccharide synthesis family protein
MTLLTDKIREMDVAGKVLTSRVTIVNQARVPGAPFRPRKAKTTLMSLLIGLMLSAGVVAGIEVLDTRIKDPDTLEQRLGVPVVGLIPLYRKDDHWLVEEAFQTLRTSIYYASDHMKNNVVLVASPSSGEGKSSVVSNLGIIMAKAGEKVLLVDCDVRKSSLHRFLHLDGKKGISDFLATPGLDPKDFIKPTSHENLSLMPSGPAPLNPPALFSLTKFRDFLTWARKEYDWVLLDTPPFVAVTDGMLIAGYADLILFVAAMKSTHEPLLKKALEMVYRLDKDLAGVVLNRFDWRLPDYYHYYYGRYYSKHYRYYNRNAEQEPPQGRGAALASMLKKRVMGDRHRHRHPSGPSA